ncbi:MAG: hypothetical protein ACC656_06550, partial [Candidatus Heimdallarchaeota archaeon]
MGNKYHYGIYGLAFAALVLLISSPVAAAPNLNSVNLNALSTEPNMEFIQLIPGKDSAVLTNIYAFGATDNLAGDVESGLSTASEWLVLYGNLEDFDLYLNRIPIEIPNGLILIVSYDKSDGFADAANAKAYIEGLYGISLLHIDDEVSTGYSKYVFWAEPSDALMAAVAADVEAVSSTGFTGSMAASLVTGSPVSWAGYGVSQFDGARVSVQGMGFVDPDGITTSGTELTLSTMNTLGAAVSSLDSTSFGLSRIEFKFPYPISPNAGGISPATTNPLPHVTGQMVWDVRHPAYTSTSASTNGNYEVKFEVGLDSAFPLVTNELSVDKDKLDNQGILEVVFDLKNVGAEDAKDVTLNFPLGPNFDRIAQQDINIWTINPLYDLDPTFISTFTLSGSVSGFPLPTYNAFDLQGWYVDSGTSNPADWDSSTTSFNLLTDGSTTITIDSTVGFPQSFLDVLANDVKPTLATADPTSLTDIQQKLQASLKPGLKKAFNASLNTYYVKQDAFNFNNGSFSLVKEEVISGLSSTREEWFLRAVVPNIAANGGTAQLSFS